MASDPIRLRLRVSFTDAAAAAGDEEARALLTPRRGTAHAAGLDVVAANTEAVVLEPGARALIPTGVRIALPNGYEAQVRPRSGLALKHGVTVLNGPGTIDADYRGEVGVILINHGEAAFEVLRGMRVAQLVVAAVSSPTVLVVDELEETGRGAGGFGSTGVQGAASGSDPSR
jgi:dUTP pyrophosphatase